MRTRSEARHFSPSVPWLGVWLACLLASGGAWADDSPGYDRPGFGFATRPVGAGQFAFEQGLPDWSRSRDAGQSTTLTTFDSLLRAGLGSGFELQLGTSPANRLAIHGDNVNEIHHGRGDSIIGLKWAPSTGSDAWSWGALLNYEFTDGAHAIRNDHPTTTLGLDVDQKLTDNVDLGYFAQLEHSGHHSGYVLAPSWNLQLSDQVGTFIEAAWERDPQQGQGSQAGAGLFWQPWDRLQLDTWLRRRLGGHVPVWEAGLGVSVLFGR